MRTVASPIELPVVAPEPVLVSIEAVVADVEHEPIAEIEIAPVVAPEPVPVAAAPVIEVAPVREPAPAPKPSDALSYWGLREPAFDNAPTARFLYLSPEHAEALFRMRYAIHHRKGCAVLTGNSGCGKTTLTRALVRELDPQRFDVALITNPLSSPADLLREILFQLGVRTTATDKPGLVRALEARLFDNLQKARDTVVIVDEAQLIEDDDVFNELRLLLNFQTNDRFLITLVLSGSAELLQTLRRHPHLAQRCVVRAGLEPLDREQTAHYVHHRLVTAGRESETLTDDAVDELFAATGGTPRLINTVCDLTLFVGAAAGLSRVDATLIRQVAEDMTAVPA
jgi:general secretion pathway protein A